MQVKGEKMDRRKGFVQLVGAVLLGGVLASSAAAQMMAPPPVPNVQPHDQHHPVSGEMHYDKHHPYATRFGDFLDQHSQIESDLTKHPDWGHQHDYIEKHPDLRDYLKNHPDVAEQLRTDPHKFMKRVHHTQALAH